MFDVVAKVVALVGRNGVVQDVTVREETKDAVKVRANVQVSTDDYRQVDYTINKPQ
jgi:hypothetical protein